MAHYECQHTGSVQQRAGEAHMVPRAYERFSGFSGSRVRLTIAILAPQA
jgi:hypothetical protein